MADDIKVVGLSNSTSGSKTNWKVMGAVIGIVVLAFGVIAGIVLVRQQQNISEKAATATCKEQCPGTDGNLYNCHPTESDGSAAVSTCNSAGRIEFCGTKNYCCPAAGGQWTADMTKCATPTPTASATATATATATSTATATTTATATSTSKSTATATSTATAKASSTATAVPIPVTGVEWPTVVGGGLGIIMILVSLALAI